MSTSFILVINAGSSSLKFSLFGISHADALEPVLRGQVDGIGARPRLTAQDGAGRRLIERDFAVSEVSEARDALRLAGAWLREHLQGGQVMAVGHRVVHGGADYAQPILIDEVVDARIEQLIPLAPLHQPHNLAAIRAVREWQPQTPQVACFDTAFHRSHPQIADLYALPRRYYEAGVRRYGFHGLSYEYIAHALPRIAPEIAHGRVVVAHLGSGASLCALKAGRSVDSTMGFSVLDGIPMGTRPGALDPGVLLHLVVRLGMTVAELEHLLYRESGLLGLSGISNDMRLLLESEDPYAQLAVDYFVHHVAKQIGALAAVLGGLDGLVFTAGIGENSAEIRARIMQACGWLGVRPDSEANRHGGPCISGSGSAASAWVIATNEELMIARHTLALVTHSGSPAV